MHHRDTISCPSQCTDTEGSHRSSAGSSHARTSQVLRHGLPISLPPPPCSCPWGPMVRSRHPVIAFTMVQCYQIRDGAKSAEGLQSHGAWTSACLTWQENQFDIFLGFCKGSRPIQPPMIVSRSRCLDLDCAHYMTDCLPLIHVGSAMCNAFLNTPVLAYIRLSLIQRPW